MTWQVNMTLEYIYIYFLRVTIFVKFVVVNRKDEWTHDALVQLLNQAFSVLK